MTIFAVIGCLNTNQRSHCLIRWWTVLPLSLLLASLITADAAAARKQKDPSPGKPSLTRAEPRGLQRGVPARVKLTGTNLAEVTALKLHSPKLTGDLAKDTKPGAKEIWITVTAAADTSRDAYEISLVSKHGESNRLKLYVDDLPQISESAGKGQGNEPTRLELPAAWWGTIETAGDEDQIEFDARSGQTIVFELAAKSVGSKAASLVLKLVDAHGHTLASNGGFEDGGDPLLAYRFRAKGRYGVRVSDQMLSGSLDHFYRLTVGAFPYVTGIFPLSVATNTTTDVALIGYNLPRRSTVQLTADKGGEMVLPIDTERFRVRRPFKVLIDAVTEVIEREPNDLPRQATRMSVPGSAGGRIWADGKRQAADTDLFLFEARAGQQLIIETSAARRGSPLDTRLNVLHADGTPVQRLLLQAVRDSQINFRSIDSVTLDARVDNWREMELNQFLYLQGEVCRIFRMPQGPDSGFQFYRSNGKRRAYFDTTPTAHALDEPCYIVEPHPPGAKLVSNGLPVFPLHYSNDDDGDRSLGTDSRVHFTAPADGGYLARVTDTRGFQGELYAYRLRIHEAQPDFKVTLTGTNPTVGQGSGESFNVKAERIDGFDGDIQVDVAGVPPGLTITTPLVIQAGHSEADGSLFAGPEAVAPAPDVARAIRVTATAMIGGKKAVKMVNNFGEIKLGPKPKLLIALEPDAPAPDSAVARQPVGRPLEIVIAPGQTVPAWLRVVRNGETNLVNLDVDNLPHGVIIDNIGLNGVQVRAGESEREIFLHAAKWVPETAHLCHAVLNSARAGSSGAGKQTSLPVLLKVRKATPQVVAKER